jgi:hypothetical protein
MHSHSHLSTPGPSSLLSIDFCLDPWLPSVGTCIVSSPWIQRSPTSCPWWKRESERGTKKNLVRYDHPRSRGIGSTQPPETGLLSFGKPCLKLLSFYPWPGIARLLRHLASNRPLGSSPSCKLYAPSPPSHSGVVVCLSALATFGSVSLSQLFHIKIRNKKRNKNNGMPPSCRGRR